MMEWLSERSSGVLAKKPKYSRTSMAADLGVPFEECEKHGWPCDHCRGTGNAAGLGHGESCIPCDGYGLAKGGAS